MRTPKFILAAALVLAIGSSAGVGAAADRMVGIVPSDGVAMLVKEFAVGAGTTITGVEFESNDPRTVFPEVVLFRGPLGALGEGTPLASAAGVGESFPGVVVVTWSTTTVASEAGTYYIGVCPPAGPGKQGLGLGPALGATDVAEPNGSYLTCGPERALLPIQVDLTMSLLMSAGSGGGPSKAGAPPAEQPEGPEAVTTFLRARPVPGGARVEFGVEEEAPVTLVVYDVAGRQVRELVREPVVRGRHEHTWDGRDARGEGVSSGVYFVQLRVGTRVLSEKLVMLR